MTVPGRDLWVAAALLMAVPPATAAADVAMDIDCPVQAAPGSTITTTVHLENRECSEANVRIVSSIAGNPSEALGQIGIFGPEIAGPTIVVPAATNGCPPGCCPITPGIEDVADLPIPTPIPGSLAGTVAAVVLVTEWDLGGSPPATAVGHCLVEVTDCSDLDDDGICDDDDNCPYFSNPGQSDLGGIGLGSPPDGIGDDCQCGDVNGSGDVTIADSLIVRRALLVPPSAEMTRSDLCDVGGSLDCSIADSLIIRRALLVPPSADIVQQCEPASP